jgi:uncharacterized protein YukE
MLDGAKTPFAAIGEPLSPRGAIMAQAIVDPAELRRFAMTLKKFNSELTEQLTALGGQLGALGTSWRDQENIKFVEEFEQQAKIIGRFVEMTNQHIPFLLRKAERVEEYLEQR